MAAQPIGSRFNLSKEGSGPSLSVEKQHREKPNSIPLDTRPADLPSLSQLQTHDAVVRDTRGARPHGRDT